MNNDLKASDLPTEALQSMPATFQHLLETLPETALRWSPTGEWSIAGILTHLSINEVLMTERLHQIVKIHEPLLTVFRADVLVPRAGHPGLSVDGILEHWRTLRFQLCDWLAACSPDDWEQQAIHPARGRTTLRVEADQHLEHDKEHLAQAIAVCEAWKAHVK